MVAANIIIGFDVPVACNEVTRIVVLTIRLTFVVLTEIVVTGKLVDKGGVVIDKVGVIVDKAVVVGDKVVVAIAGQVIWTKKANK